MVPRAAKDPTNEITEAGQEQRTEAVAQNEKAIQKLKAEAITRLAYWTIGLSYDIRIARN